MVFHYDRKIISCRLRITVRWVGKIVVPLPLYWFPFPFRELHWIWLLLTCIYVRILKWIPWMELICVYNVYTFRKAFITLLKQLHSLLQQLVFLNIYQKLLRKPFVDSARPIQHCDDWLNSMNAFCSSRPILEPREPLQAPPQTLFNYFLFFILTWILNVTIYNEILFSEYQLH